MKKVLSILVAVLLTASVFAQTPEKMSYQAVVRNNENTLVQNTPVGMQLSILQGSADGTAVYIETQMPTTNTNGLVSLDIGSGEVISGNFSTIDWANNTYFIKTETDPAGGSNYSITSTSQLLSVPYALHAKTAKNGITTAQATKLTNLSGTNTGDQPLALIVSQTGDTLTINGGNSVLVPGISLLNFPLPPAIGDFRDGGVVFWLDGNGGGLVVSVVDQSTNAKWGCSSIEINGANGENIGDGAQNTIDIEAECTTEGTAADICANLTLNGYSDWFLPSIKSLKAIYNNKSIINDKVAANGGTNLASNYWSSTEHESNNGACYLMFNFGGLYDDLKSATYSVRAVRAF